MNIWRQSPSGRFTSENLITNDIAKGFWEASGIAYYGILKRWAGSWIETSLKVFTGTWQTKPLKRWDGTEWKLINS
jgi:hypothetical protein